MRKILTIILATLYLLKLHGQCELSKDQVSLGGDCSTFISNNLANSDQTALANDRITFNAGFSLSNTSSHTFTAKIAYPEATREFVSYLTTPVDAVSRVLDKTNSAPGSINGVIDVTPTGSASYNIPIEVPPGSNGMQPNLSINYNSQSGNDILGYGWRLAGLSAITRVNKSKYYDQTTAPVSLNDISATTSVDGLMVDGQRMILNPNAANTWSPEYDPYTYITYDGSAFTVTSKDGLTMEYGNANYNAQFIVNGTKNPYTWALNKITDANGNYIEFIYENNNGEYYISTINYTGNIKTGAKPYNSICFYYAQRSDKNTKYIANGVTNATKLLTDIKVYAEGQLSKKYSFTYYNDGLYSKLNQISFAADGVSYNPTIINWGAGSPDYTVQVNDAGSTMGNLYNNPNTYFGDFNGDGRKDIAQCDKNKTKVTIRYGQDGGTFSSAKAYALPASKQHTYTRNTSITTVTNSFKYKDVSFMDYNNDGKDEIVVHCLDSYTEKDEYTPCSTDPMLKSGSTQPCVTPEPSYYYFVSDEVAYYPVNGDNLGERVLVNYTYLAEGNTPPKAPDDDYTHYYGDFDNNGSMDIINFKNKSFLGTSSTLDLKANLILNNIEDIKIADFDGDGQIEFLALTNEGKGAIYKYNAITQLFYNTYGDIAKTVFGKQGRLYLGDFNGDGKTDYLSYIGGTTPWKIYYGTGSGFTSGNLPAGLSLSNYDPALTGALDETEGVNKWNYNYTVVGSGTGIDGVYTQYCASNSQYPENAIYYPSSSIHVSDINDDGKSDIIYALNGNVSCYLSKGNEFIHINSTKATSLTKITDINDVYLNTVDLNGDGQLEIIYSDDDYPQSSTQSGADYLGGPYNLVVYDCDAKYTITSSPAIHDNYKIISFTSSLFNQHLVSSITDGNNIKTTIEYSSVLTKVSATPAYPLMPVTEPMILVSNYSTRDLGFAPSNTLSQVYFTFQDGYIHLDGIGFLGYSKVSSTDIISGNSKTYNYSFTLPSNNNVYYTWINSQSASVYDTRSGSLTASSLGSATSTLLSAITNKLDTKGGNLSLKLFNPYIQEIKVSDKLKGYTTTTTKTFDATIGRVTSVLANTNDGWSIETKQTFSQLQKNQSRLLQEETKRIKGTDSWSAITSYTYDASQVFLVNSITQSGITTKYNSFDKYNNPTNISYIASDGTRGETREYDPYGRFIVSVTNTSNNYTSSATYRAGDGAKLTDMDINGLITSYSYSSSGNDYKTTISFPDKRVSTTTLSWCTSVSGVLYTVTSTVTGGKTAKEYYNALGQKLQEDVSGFNGATLTTKYFFNANGTIKEMRRPGNVTVQYSYDACKRPLEIKGLNHDICYTSYATNPYTVKIKDKITNQTKSQTFDALGNLTKVIDAYGKTLTYNYFANGKLRNIEGMDNSPSMTYDPVTLNQLSLTDADAGKIEYTYNGFGQLLSQKDKAGNIIQLQYNADGTLKSKTVPGSGTINYAYYQEQGKRGLFKSLELNGITQTLDYDPFGYPNSLKVTDGSNTFLTTCTYNNGSIANISYPTGLNLNYIYDDAGNIKQIDNASDGKMIWKGNSKNPIDKWTGFSYGNGLTTTWTYDTKYRLNGIKTVKTANSTVIQDLGFSFNELGNLTQRIEKLLNLSENFGYTDGMDRLNSSQVYTAGVAGTLYNYSFKDNGNIDSTTLMGAYRYGATQPHAVSSVGIVTNPVPAKSVQTSTIFDAENRISNITATYTDNSQSLINNLTYGPDGSRYKVDFVLPGNTYSKVYAGNNEFIIKGGAITSSRTFIYAPTGICAVYEKDASNNVALHYVHADYLGSWLLYTDKNGTIEKDANGKEYSYSYDAWGRPRDPKTWKLLSIDPASAMASLSVMQPRYDRGYTGHEQMAGFGLINMNGRLYDPYLQRMLSPDRILQDPSNSQNYNRYSYVFNNPLKYVDPTGFTGDYWDASQDPDMPQDNSGGWNSNSTKWDWNGNSSSHQWNENSTSNDDPYSFLYYSDGTQDGYAAIYSNSEGQLSILFDYSGNVIGIQEYAFNNEISNTDWTLPDVPNYIDNADEVGSIIGGMVQGGGELTKADALLRTKQLGKITAAQRQSYMAGKVISNSGRLIAKGSNILMGVVAGYKVLNHTDNTSTWVDIGVSGLLYTAGALTAGTVGLPVVAVVGVGYAIWSLAGGSDWIDENWGYRPVNK